MPRTPENGARMIFRWMVACDLANPRLTLPLFGRGAIVLGPGNHPLVQQPLQAVEVQVRQIALRLGRSQLRLLLSGIEDGQHVALADRLAGFEGDAGDHAGKVGADGHAPHGGDRADRRQRRRPVRLLATIVVTASGGGWNAAPCAIAT